MLAEWTESDECESHGCTAQEWGSGTTEFSVTTSMDVQLLGPGLGPALGAGGSTLTNTVYVSVKSLWVLFPYTAKYDSAHPGTKLGIITHYNRQHTIPAQQTAGRDPHLKSIGANAT